MILKLAAIIFAAGAFTAGRRGSGCFWIDFFIFLATCIFHHCKPVDELGGVFRGRGVLPRWLRMPLEEEEAMDADEEAEELQGD